MKQPKPDIPKLTIVQIGTVNEDGTPCSDWVFDGSSHPNSIYEYISEDWHLIAGYTIDELREISNSYHNKIIGEVR